MPLLWYMLRRDCWEVLRHYQWRYFRKRLLPPHYEGENVAVMGNIESLGEIDQIIRQPPHPHRRGAR